MIRRGAGLALTAAVAMVWIAGCASSDDGDASVGSPASVTFLTVPPATAESETTVAPPTSAPATVAPPTESSEAGPSTTQPSTVAPATEPAPTVPLGDPVVAVEVIGSFSEPLDLAWRTGDTTMFVVEQGGRIVPWRDGVSGEPVLDIDDRVDSGGERGLLGLTFSPDGSLAYVDYTDNNGDTVIAEFPVAADGTMDRDAERVLLQIEQPYENHNGGNVTIGPDGMLYIGMGDGGSAGDPQRRALNVSELLGKILRIDPSPSAGAPYTVPADNPFVGVAGARGEIWSVGVRNPWRIAFDATTADLWFADVGQGAWEEVDVARAANGSGRGANFGWSAFEGTHRYNDDQSPDGVTPPVYEYPHGDLGCSVSGGAVYRGAAIPALTGWYVFGDYCTSELTAILVDGSSSVKSVQFAGPSAPGAVRAAPDGELYVASLDGDVARLVQG